MKMIDREKMKNFQIAGVILAFLLVVGLIFWGLFASGGSKTTKSEKKPKTTKVKKVEGGELTHDYVEEFLTAYFTKKELEENRNRYLPYMTEGAYQQEITTEEEPSVQTYKGYIVNTKLKSATIYIDSENGVVLATVNYSQTELQKKGDYSSAQTDVSATSTLRLKYVKTDGKYLVSRIEPVLIVDTLNSSQEASIPKFNQPQQTTTESSQAGGEKSNE